MRFRAALWLSDRLHWLWQRLHHCSLAVRHWEIAVEGKALRWKP